MWNNNDDYSDDGVLVKLYHPSHGPPGKNNTAPLDSHIGGHGSGEEDAPSCAKCQSPMYLFVQLRRVNEVTKEDRFLCVYGCPRSDCFDKVTFEKGFASGGQGVMCCKTRQRPVPVATNPSAPAVPVKDTWYDDNDDDADNDWGLDDGKDDISNLESAVAAMEASLDGGVIAKSNKEKLTPKAATPAPIPSTDSFHCYLLNQQDEPPAPRQQIEEDDVGQGASDDKIRNMLARYMAEEEDLDILAALNGASDTGGGGGGGEEDERLSDEDRILYGFQDRLRRASRQVVRYARGGVPLWSIPSESKKKEAFWTVPPCSCGTQRSFEFQLLPSLLHFLKVDKFSGKETESGINGWLSNGMNWGSIAVFTCPNNNCNDTEEALVIQETVDKVSEMQGRPQMDFSPTVAVVEDMDDDADFKPDE
jgi:pre-rRNA-processing protein TSR4